MLREPGALAIAALFGLVFGSFVTALSYRLPRGESIAAGRSRCPSCGTTLGALDLVPVLSWIFTRGRCRHCGTAVSWRYPAIEATTMMCFVSAAFFAPSLSVLAVLLSAGTMLVALAVIDLEFERLPNGLVALLLVAMIAWRWLSAPDVAELAIGFGTGIAVLLLLFGVNWVAEGRARVTLVGPGDSKLIAIAAVGLAFWPFVVFLAVMALIAILAGLFSRLRTGRWHFPLGPAYALALWICLLSPGFGNVLLAA